ncbi:ACT domain-containing protein [Kangiella shandongensis]|uniref:ACT domain-containing protein n=1 Tax=Kangiella shandongensis TaxID=2763258 RepID=UPI001CC112AF|nr:ACT domain-containing protein [Kangiella shandongensis]
MSINDLSTLLSDLQPELHQELYVFCTSKAGIPPGVKPLATFQEAEGLSFVCTEKEAKNVELQYGQEEVMRLISLNVYSSLSAIGMTAAISDVLTRAGISANVVAAYHHDHLFVPQDRAEEALSLLSQFGDRPTV